METLDNFQDYTAKALENFAARDERQRHSLFESIKGRSITRVLDVGCGAGQDLLSFLEKTDATCVGVDISPEIGIGAKALFENDGRMMFVQSEGELLPFANESFDVILCRVALPYMNNRDTISEVARVLKPDGAFLLKTHAPLFYFGMIRERLRSLNPKMLIYPLLYLAASFWHVITGKQLRNGIWRGKEVFQTRSFLEREFERNGLRIEGPSPNSSRQTPSYLVVKMVL